MRLGPASSRDVQMSNFLLSHQQPVACQVVPDMLPDTAPKPRTSACDTKRTIGCASCDGKTLEAAMIPQNWWLEDYFTFGMPSFEVLPFLQEGYPSKLRIPGKCH